MLPQRFLKTVCKDTLGPSFSVCLSSYEKFHQIGPAEAGEETALLFSVGFSKVHKYSAEIRSFMTSCKGLFLNDTSIEVFVLSETGNIAEQAPLRKFFTTG